MTVARDQHKDNIVLGAGEIFIDRYVEKDKPTGRERYLGDSVGGTISVTSERTTIQSGDGQVAQDLVDIIRSVSRTIGFTLHDMSLENWGLFLIGGSPGEKTIAPTKNLKQTIGDLKKGESAMLGLGPDTPSGVGEVEKDSFTAKNGENAINANNIVYDDATAPKDASPEIRVDLKAGMVTALKNQMNLNVVYTPVAKDINFVKATKETKQITCALRYIEQAPAGKGRNVYVRKCNLVPSGEAALKSRDTEQQMAFTGTVVEPDGGYAFISIDDTPLTTEAA